MTTTQPARAGAHATPWSPDAMRARVVRYADLAPCLNAFIDTRSPGSETKENFTIIGPGVSENPDQHVHIAEPHGFNIGGARQPPGCVNSQHSHTTAEVFVAHTGHWRFDLGETGEDAQVHLAPGDAISIPTNLFRGFTNTGDGTGFLWAVLGRDDPGRVMWAPQVFDLAREHGLVLLESGRLIDTTRGEAPTADQRVMPATTAAMVAELDRVSAEDAESFVWRGGAADGDEGGGGGRDRLIGPDGQWRWPHGFTLDRVAVPAGGDHALGAGDAARVLFVHEGAMALTWADGRLELGAGDTMTVPRGLDTGLESDAGATVFQVDGDDGQGD